MWHRQVAAPAVAEDNDRVGVFQGSRVLRPFILVSDSFNLRHALIEPLGQKQATGVVLVAAVTVALGARQEDDLLAFRLAGGLVYLFFVEDLDADVAELHFHGRPLVELKRDQALVAPHLGVFIGAIDHLLAVDRMGQMVSLGDDLVGVPLASLDVFEQLVGVAHFSDDFGLVVLSDDGLVAALAKESAEPLAVEHAVELHVVGQIGLISADDPLGVGFFPTAELNTRVVVDQPVLDLQLEIARLATSPNDERVSLGGVVGRGLAGDGAVLHAPELGIAVPSLECFPVEDGHEPLLVFSPPNRGGQKCRDQHQGG